MRLLLTTLVAALLCLVGGGTALADPGLVIGDGAPAAPGTSLRAQMGCEEAGTTPVTGPGVTGGAWERDADGHQPWAVFSAVTVAADAAPGPVTVTATCGGRPMEATLTVAAPDTGDTTWRVVGGAAILLVIVAAMVLLQRRRKQAAGR
ncbi:LPXTG cell wall anchor domain-containing protein [Actinomycetospora aeridis]|uniref:LPXTG cell wall anchor domain-containing protein n=1 Tax=Actinomycetospora aeridis TaxID=3129231 RepID=A0ABU8N2N5_9PSEU